MKVPEPGRDGKHDEHEEPFDIKVPLRQTAACDGMPKTREHTPGRIGKITLPLGAPRLLEFNIYEEMPADEADAFAF